MSLPSKHPPSSASLISCITIFFISHFQHHLKNLPSPASSSLSVICIIFISHLQHHLPYLPSPAPSSLSATCIVFNSHLHHLFSSHLFPPASPIILLIPSISFVSQLSFPLHLHISRYHQHPYPCIIYCTVNLNEPTHENLPSLLCDPRKACCGSEERWYGESIRVSVVYGSRSVWGRGVL